MLKKLKSKPKITAHKGGKKVIFLTAVFTVPPNFKIKTKDNILSSTIRIDKPNDSIQVDSLNDEGERLNDSLITITKDDKIIWKGNFQQLSQNLDL